MCTVNQKTSRLKWAEFLSGVGAVVLGLGLGLLKILIALHHAVDSNRPFDARLGDVRQTQV